jgi:NitT/TauT family transport system permease protein
MKYQIVKKDLSRGKYFAISLVSFIIIGAAWVLTTNAKLISPFFLPTPQTTIHAMIELFYKNHLLIDIWASFYRIMVGFLLSVIVAFPLGLLIGSNVKAEALLNPFTNFIRYMPPSALVPLFILWFGVGDLQKFMIIFISVAPYLTLLIADVVANIRTDFLEAAYMFGASRMETLKKVILPASMPGIWDAMRIMIGAAWSFVIFAEIVAAESGLGHLIIQSQRFLQTPKVISGILVIGILGIITDYLFRIGHRKFFPWVEK